MTLESEMFKSLDALEVPDDEFCVLVFDCKGVADRYHLHRAQYFPQPKNGGWIILTRIDRDEVVICRDSIEPEYIQEAVRACSYVISQLGEGKIDLEEYEQGKVIDYQSKDLPEDFEAEFNVPSPEELRLLSMRAELLAMEQKDGLIVTEILAKLAQMLGRHGAKALFAMQLALAHHEANEVRNAKMKSNAQNN